MAATSKIKSLLTSPIKWPSKVKAVEIVDPTAEEITLARKIAHLDGYRFIDLPDSVRRYCAAHAVAMYNMGGRSLGAIGSEFGVEASTINVWVREANGGHLIRGRGRPCGPVATHAVSNARPPEVVAEVKRGRGRPAKATTVVAEVKRGRGRPAKATAVVAEVKRGRPAKATTVVAEVKRGRGRPAKATTVVAEVKRGRPAKATAVVAEVKRGRGRPAKAA